MTNLPSSVQKAADYADALEQSLKADAPVEQKPEAAEALSEAEAPKQENETEKLRAKYSSLQGKYNAEVPALHSRAKELEARLQQLADENKALRSEIAEAEAKKPFITEQDVEAFGEDMIDVMRRSAQAEGAKYAQQAAELGNRLVELEQRIAGMNRDSVAARQQAFYSGLTNALPDWEAQNEDPAFIEWLQGTDETFGMRRNDALQNAFQALDAARVAKIFKAYRVAKQPPASSGLAKQVAPTHSRGAGSPTAPAGKTWTQQEIAGFYDAWMHGRVSDEEAQRIEQEINDAVAQGRVSA